MSAEVQCIEVCLLGAPCGTTMEPLHETRLLSMELVIVVEVDTHRCQHEPRAAGCLRQYPDVQSTVISFVCGTRSAHAAEQHTNIICQLSKPCKTGIDTCQYLHQDTSLDNVSLEDIVLIKEGTVEGH